MEANYKNTNFVAQGPLSDSKPSSNKLHLPRLQRPYDPCDSVQQFPSLVRQSGRSQAQCGLGKNSEFLSPNFPLTELTHPNGRDARCGNTNGVLESSDKRNGDREQGKIRTCAIWNGVQEQKGLPLQPKIRCSDLRQ